LDALVAFVGMGRAYKFGPVKKKRRPGWSAVSGHMFLQGSIQHATAWSRKGRYRKLDLPSKQKQALPTDGRKL